MKISINSGTTVLVIDSVEVNPRTFNTILKMIGKDRVFKKEFSSRRLKSLSATKVYSSILNAGCMDHVKQSQTKRQLLRYALYLYAKEPLKQIKALNLLPLGNDHSSLIHGYNTICRVSDYTPDIKLAVELIKTIIEDETRSRFARTTRTNNVC